MLLQPSAPGCRHQVSDLQIAAPPARCAAAYESRMAPMLARQKGHDGGGLAMPAHREHDTLVSPVHPQPRSMTRRISRIEVETPELVSRRFFHPVLAMLDVQKKKHAAAEQGFQFGARRTGSLDRKSTRLNSSH